MEDVHIKLIKNVFDRAIKGEISVTTKNDAKKALEHWKQLLTNDQELAKQNKSLNEENTRLTEENTSLRKERGKSAGQMRKLYDDKSQQTEGDEANTPNNERPETANRSSKWEDENSRLKLDQDSLKHQRQRTETPNLVAKLQKENAKLKLEVETYQRNIEELETRLSSIAGSKMTEANPNITDLSDPYRPTLLGEQFRGLYENEWTDLMTYMEREGLKEPESIDVVCEIIKTVNEFCLNAKSQQFQKLFEFIVGEVRNPEVKDRRKSSCVKYTANTTVELDALQEKTVERFVLDLQKAFSVVSCEPLIQIFDTYFMEDFRTKHVQLKNGCQELINFVSKAVKMLWMMKGHRPPVVLFWSHADEPYDKEKFSYYTCKGGTVSQCIWPAVLLHKDGPVIARGFAQGK